MESYLEEGVKDFNQLVETQMENLLSDIESHPTFQLKAIMRDGVQKMKVVFLGSVAPLATQLDDQIIEFRKLYGHRPELLDPALKSIRNQFHQSVSMSQSNMDNYISGIRKDLNK